MLEIVFSTFILLALIAYKVPAVLSLMNELNNDNSLHERNDKKFCFFCDNLKRDTKSTLTDKKHRESII